MLATLKRRGGRAMHPADLVVHGILATVCAVLVVAFARGAPVGGSLAAHGALLGGWIGFSWLASRSRASAWLARIRAVAVVATMFTLYGTLAQVPFISVPWLADTALDTVDRFLFAGHSPALFIDRVLSTNTVEVLSFFYAAFIPYLYFSIFLGLVGRPAIERDEFITGFALLYAASFLGYLFAPARGPIIELATLFEGELTGGRFHGIVTAAIDAAGGPHGAFPSLHVGASIYACAFDFRRGDPLRGLMYVPLVAMIVAATVALRYHYVVDLIAGAALALLAGAVAARLGSGFAPPFGGDGGFTPDRQASPYAELAAHGDLTAGIVATTVRLQRGARWLAAELPTEFAELERRIQRYATALDRLGITAAEANLPIRAGRAAFFLVRELEILVVGLPVAIWGAVNHWPAYRVTSQVTRRLSTDRDHFASNAVFTGVPIFLSFYALQLAAALLLLPAPLAAAYAVLLPFAGAVTLLYRDRAGGAIRRIRTFLLLLRRPDHQRRLAAEAREIRDQIHRLTDGEPTGGAKPCPVITNLSADG